MRPTASFTLILLLAAGCAARGEAPDAGDADTGDLVDELGRVEVGLVEARCRCEAAPGEPYERCVADALQHTIDSEAELACVRDVVVARGETPLACFLDVRREDRACRDATSCEAAASCDSIERALDCLSEGMFFIDHCTGCVTCRGAAPRAADDDR